MTIISDWKSLLYSSMNRKQSKAIKFVRRKIPISDHLTLSFRSYRPRVPSAPNRTTTINQKLFKRGSTFFDTPFVDKMPSVFLRGPVCYYNFAVFKVRTYGFGKLLFNAAVFAPFDFVHQVQLLEI